MIRVVRYRPSALAVRALGLSSLALFAAYLAWTDTLAVAWIVVFAAGYAAFCHVRAAVLDRPALAMSETGLMIDTLFRSWTLRWNEISDIQIQALAPRYLSMVPLPRRTFLTFALAGQPGQISCKLAGKLLDVPAAGLLDLQVQLAGRLEVCSAQPASQQARRPDEEFTFDPDAAIARYLARRSSAPPSMSPALKTAMPRPLERPTFGRRRG